MTVMTVAELRERLKTIPGMVEVWAEGCDCVNEVNKVVLREDNTVLLGISTPRPPKDPTRPLELGDRIEYNWPAAPDGTLQGYIHSVTEFLIVVGDDRVEYGKDQKTRIIAPSDVVRRLHD